MAKRHHLLVALVLGGLAVLPGACRAHPGTDMAGGPAPFTQEQPMPGDQDVVFQSTITDPSGSYHQPGLFMASCLDDGGVRLTYRSTHLGVPVSAPAVSLAVDGRSLEVPAVWEVAEETRTYVDLAVSLAAAEAAPAIEALRSGRKLVLRTDGVRPDVFDLTAPASGAWRACAG